VTLAAPAAMPAPTPMRVDVGHLQVLLINGGGRKTQNYQSHLLHLRGLHDVLRQAGVPEEMLWLYVSDGDDPAPDVALRDAQPEADFWLLEGSRLDKPLRTPVTYADSEVPGAHLAAATRANLEHWFDTTGRTMRAGDTLLIYVTDHGTRTDNDPENNAITLWGDGEKLTVSDLGRLLGRLDPGVRVVSLMSQCYSGGFAGLARARGGGAAPDGLTCGYFSSTADRPAYGCYPENRGRDNVGHSFHFIAALAQRGDLPSAHEEVLVNDASPDVPLRTSDLHLGEVLDRAAAAAGQKRAAFVDALLAQAWRTPEPWEPDIRLLDRVAHAYGFAGPRSMTALDSQTDDVTPLVAQLRTLSKTWQATLDSAAGANVERFIAARPDWADRLDDETLRSLGPESARALTGSLLAELGPATRSDAETAQRLDLLRARAAESAEVAYRMDVRAGVLLRLRAMLESVAGRVYLAQRGTSEERAAYEALRRCEALAFQPGPLPDELQLARVEPFPPLDDDLGAANRVIPAWMGVQFKQASETARATKDLPAGAARIVAVYDGSPARAAGLRIGDLVLGPPGQHFEEPNQIREWTMLSPVGRPARLDVQRDGHRVAVTLEPGRYPQRWPSLPGPPKVGTKAPPLRLEGYRGKPPTVLATGRPHLLFFWATWCTICKSALPEVEAFARERGTTVVAITDEDRSRLDPFFAAPPAGFPPLVAIDEERTTFGAYGVGGLPTFVLVDGKGVVRGSATGYAPAKGLALDGWHWTGRPHASPG
jgi:thiol-disulfide isomerase/thioredoxin